MEREDAEILRERVEEPPEFNAEQSQPRPALPDKQFAITRVVFVGNSVIPDEELAARVPLAGRTVSVADLLDAARAATQAYRDRGYNVAQVVIPPQDMADGTVTFIVLEGRLDKDGLEIVDLSGGSIDVARVTRILMRGVNEDEIIQRGPYERALRLVDTLPGVRVRSWLYPGDEVGAAKLRTELHPVPAVQGELAIDNYGLQDTGSERVSLDLHYTNPGRTHIAVDVGLSYSGNENYFTSGHVTVPLGNDGLTIGGGADRLVYSIVDNPNFRGNSGTADHYIVETRYPLVLNADTAFYGRLAYNHLAQTDRTSNVVTNRENGDFGTLSLEWTRSAVGAVARTTAAFSVSYGDIRNLVGPDTFLTNGNFWVWRLDAAHLRRWSPRFYSIHALGAQTSSRNLNGYLRCHVGGPISNRAYPLGEGSGDQCISLDNEFVVEIGPAGSVNTLQLVLIADAARMKEFRKDIPQVPNESFTLASVGAGLRFEWRNNFELRAEWAYQLADSPNRERTGVDTDGRSARSRFWVQGLFRF